MTDKSIDLVAHALEVKARVLIDEISKTERKDIAISIILRELESMQKCFDVGKQEAYKAGYEDGYLDCELNNKN